MKFYAPLALVNLLILLGLSIDGNIWDDDSTQLTRTLDHRGSLWGSGAQLNWVWKLENIHGWSLNWDGSQPP